MAPILVLGLRICLTDLDSETERVKSWGVTNWRQVAALSRIALSGFQLWLIEVLPVRFRRPPKDVDRQRMADEATSHSR